MSLIFENVYVAAAVVFLFGAAIFVHEFGHFWVALKRGLKVEEFAIGFGPKVLSWKRNGIEYSLRWIPAGGFVRLPQMLTSTVLEGDGKKAASFETPIASATSSEPAPAEAAKPAEENLAPISALSKILVSIAGPTMNVLFAFALATLIYFVGLPVAVNPPIIGYVDPKSPEAKLGIQENDRIVAVDGKPVKSWDEIFRTTAVALTNMFQVTIVKDGGTNLQSSLSNTYALMAESAGALDIKSLNLNSQDHLVVGEIKEGSAAAIAHVQPQDEIISLAGQAITSREELTKLVQAFGGKKTPLVVKRGTELLTIEVTPKLDSPATNYLLGVVYAPGKDYFDIEHPTPVEQVRDVWGQLSSTFVALVHPRESGVKASDLAGPVGIFGMLALMVKSDFRLALHFLVIVNINLAVLNMLPIPVLDGGHVLMAILERIRRRPLDVRIVEYTTTAFAVLLISFMLYITFFDVKRISLFHRLWNRGTEIVQPGNSGGPAPAEQPSPR